jgi:hypothetical protein
MIQRYGVRRAWMYAAHPQGLPRAAARRSVRGRCRHAEKNLRTGPGPFIILHFFTSSTLHFRIRSRESACPSQASLDLSDCTIEGGIQSVQYRQHIAMYSTRCTVLGRACIQAKHHSLSGAEKRPDRVAQNSKRSPAHEKPWHVAQIGAGSTAGSPKGSVCQTVRLWHKAHPQSFLSGGFRRLSSPKG